MSSSRFLRIHIADFIPLNLVRIIDPAEEDFPYTGRMRFEAMKGRADR